LTEKTASLSQFPATQFTVLPNNIRVASQKMSGTTASVAVFVDGGSRYDTFDNNGSANLIARLALRGTAARPGASFMQNAEASGLNITANTERDHTVFKAQCLGKSTGTAVSMLADAICNASMTEEAFQAEKAAALAEVDAMDSKPTQLIMDMLHATAYTDTTLALPVLGSLPTLTRISLAQLQADKAFRYTGQNLIVVGTGAIEHGELVSQVQAAFSSLPATAPAPVEKPAVMFTGSDVRQRNDSQAVTHLAYAFPTDGAASAHTVPLQVAGQLLGGSWNNSQVPTFQSQLLLDVIGDKMGAEAHQIQTFHVQYDNAGLFGIYAATTDQYAVKALSHSITDGFVRLSHAVEPPALYEAKLHLARQVLANIESPSQQANEIGLQLMKLGRRIHPVETVARIEAVDGGAIKAAMQKYCNDKCHALAAHGQVWEVQDYNWWRRLSYSLRY
jgi:processing peptidase subunit beta